MNSELTQSIAKWPEWIQQFQFDPDYGYLIDPEYRPACFNYQGLATILSQLQKLNQTGQIIETVKNFPQFPIDKQTATHKDMVILHDMCSYVVHSYIKVHKDRRIKQQDISVPKNLAVPLVQSASYLKVKTGMATGIGHNWQFVQKPQKMQDLTTEHIKIRFHYSTQYEFEDLFFKVSVVTSYYLSRIIKNCYELNCIITQQPNLTDEVYQRMKSIRFFLKKIFEQNMRIQLGMDKNFFFHVLRIFVAGYQFINFQGIEQRISSSGGAGGYDPSFQSFERAFGIFFDDQLGNIQQKLRNGMPESHRKLVDFFAGNSLIRQYCSLTKQLQNMYNDTLDIYIKYLQLHGTFIKNFIIQMMPMYESRPSFGATGSTSIKVVDRYKFVRDQKIKDQP